MSFEETLESIVRRVVREELQSSTSPKAGRLLKLSEAAKLASVSVSTIVKWGRAGLNIMQRGSVRRVDEAELLAFMRQRDEEKPLAPKEWAQELLSNVTPLARKR